MREEKHGVIRAPECRLRSRAARHRVCGAPQRCRAGLTARPDPNGRFRCDLALPNSTVHESVLLEGLV